MIKKVWLVILAGSVLLSGCSNTETKDKHQSDNSVSVTRKTSKAKRNSSSDNKRKVKQSSSNTQVAATLWNTAKEKQLAAFMKQWQTKMGQTYVGTYDGKQPDHLGYIFPKAITSGEMAGRVSWGKRPVELSWSTNGETGKEFQIVAVATGDKNGNGFPTSYLFCLHNQRPVVFMSQTTNGDTFTIQDTQNSELQAGFTKIVTGSMPVIKTDASLNADVASSVAASPQRIPSAYVGPWYWYSEFDGSIVKSELSDIKTMKLFYASSLTPKWLNIKGVHQAAGAGDDEYVRYRYYDGQQFPVMMMGSGARAWFDNNAYQSRAMALQMENTKFGDEPAEREE